MRNVHDPWARADLHLHTSFSGSRGFRLIDAQDSYVDPQSAYRAARRRGMDFVCFTDHNTIDGALDFLSKNPQAEPRVIVGEEVETRFPGSSAWLHLNVYGVDEEIHADLGRLRPNCFELMAELHRRNLFFVLNHPFQSFRSIGAAQRYLAAVLPLVPAVEVCNSTSPRSHRAVLESLTRSATATSPVSVGGSDAHTLRRIAAVCTAAPGDTKSEFLNNVRRGTCAIIGDAQGLWDLVRDVYCIVGQYYGRLYGSNGSVVGLRRLKNIVCSAALFPAALAGLPAALTLLQAGRQEWIARCGPWGQALARDPELLLPAAELSSAHRKD